MTANSTNPIPLERPHAAVNGPHPPSVRVATYRRVSSVHQATVGTSLATQLEVLTDLISSTRGWSHAADYCDAGVSGRRDDRPEFQRLLSDAARGKFDLVAVASLDRAGRSLLHLLEAVKKLKGYGIDFYSKYEGLNTGVKFGMTMLGIFGLVAEFESVLTQERTQSGRVACIEMGKWPFGQPPYGYRNNPETGILFVHDGEGAIIRRIYNEYAAGSTLESIASNLNHDNVPSSGRRHSEINDDGQKIDGEARGTGWRGGAVRRIMKNPIYFGRLFMNLSGVRVVDSTLARLEIIPGVRIVDVIPIVTRKEWDYCQERLERGRRQKPQTSAKWLLSGLIDCTDPTCACNYHGKPSRNKRWYSCMAGNRVHTLIIAPAVPLPDCPLTPSRRLCGVVFVMFSLTLKFCSRL